MTAENKRSAFEQRKPALLTTEDFQKMPRPDSLILGRITSMTQRNAVAVFGEDIALEVEKSMIMPQKLGWDKAHRQGTQVIHHKHAQTLLSVIKFMKWDEQDPNLQTLCARIYQHELSAEFNRQEDNDKQSQIQQLQITVAEKISDFDQRHASIIHPDLTLELFLLRNIYAADRHRYLGKLHQGERTYVAGRVKHYQDIATTNRGT